MAVETRGNAVYDRTPEQIAGAIDMLLNHKDLTIQNAEVVTVASQEATL